MASGICYFVQTDFSRFSIHKQITPKCLFAFFGHRQDESLRDVCFLLRLKHANFVPSCYSATLAKQNKVVLDLIYFPLAVWLMQLEGRHSGPVTPAVTRRKSTASKKLTAE